MHGEHAGAQLIDRFRLGAIACAEHVGHQHDIILAGHGARLADGVGAHAFPVGLHEDDRAFGGRCLVIDDHALERPAVDLIRHLLLRHRALPSFSVPAILTEILWQYSAAVTPA